MLLLTQSQQAGDTQRDPGRDGFRLDPERYPGHDYNQGRGYVCMKEMVTQPAT